MAIAHLSKMAPDTGMVGGISDSDYSPGKPVEYSSSVK